MAIFKNANKKLEQIVREEIDQPRERTRQECRDQVRKCHEQRGNGGGRR